MAKRKKAIVKAVQNVEVRRRTSLRRHFEGERAKAIERAAYAGRARIKEPEQFVESVLREYESLHYAAWDHAADHV